MFRDGGQREPDIREGEIVGNDAAPARSAELDRRRGAQSSACTHARYFSLSRQAEKAVIMC